MFNISNSGGQVCRLVFLGTIAVTLLVGCGGTDGNEVAVGDSGLEGRRRVCVPEMIPTVGYSLVFKYCDMATDTNFYYDKTECVRDNATGLIWQGQTPAGTGLRANDAYKSNFDSTETGQTHRYGKVPGWGNIAWYASGVTQAEIDEESNSIGFKNAVNASKLCGFNDWRIPSIEELRGLLKTQNRVNKIKIDEDWFPNMSRGGANFWSSTELGGGSPGPIAEYINFSDGIQSKQWREDYKAPGFSVPIYATVRLVR
jgi:Protein of unknown function (DUF1566)